VKLVPWIPAPPERPDRPGRAGCPSKFARRRRGRNPSPGHGMAAPGGRASEVHELDRLPREDPYAVERCRPRGSIRRIARSRLRWTPSHLPRKERAGRVRMSPTFVGAFVSGSMANGCASRPWSAAWTKKPLLDIPSGCQNPFGEETRRGVCPRPARRGRRERRWPGCTANSCRAAARGEARPGAG